MIVWMGAPPPPVCATSKLFLGAVHKHVDWHRPPSICSATLGGGGQSTNAWRGTPPPPSVALYGTWVCLPVPRWKVGPQVNRPCSPH